MTTSLLQEVLTPQELNALGLTDAVRRVEVHPPCRLSLRQYIQVRWALLEYCFIRLALSTVAIRGVYTNWKEFRWLTVLLPTWLDPTLLFAFTMPMLCFVYEILARPSLQGGEVSHQAVSHFNTLNAYIVNCVMLLDVAFITEMWVKGRTLLATLGAALYLCFHILPRVVLGVIALNGLYSANPCLTWDALLVSTRKLGVSDSSSTASTLTFSLGLPHRRIDSEKNITHTTAAAVAPNNSNTPPTHTHRKSELSLSYMSPKFTLLRFGLRTRVFLYRMLSICRMCWPHRRRGDQDSRSPTALPPDIPSCESPDSTLLWPPAPPNRSLTSGPSLQQRQRRWTSVVLESLSPGWRSARNFVYSQLSHHSGRTPSRSDDRRHSRTELEMVGAEVPLQEHDACQPVLTGETELRPTTSELRDHPPVGPPRRSQGMTPDAYRVLVPPELNDTLDPASSPSPTGSMSPSSRPETTTTTVTWRRLIGDPTDVKVLDSLEYITRAVAAPPENTALLDCFALIVEAYHIVDGLRWVVAADLQEQLDFLLSLLVLLYMHVTALGINLLRFHCLIVPVVVDGVSAGSFSVTTLIALLLSIGNCLTLFVGAAYDEQIVTAIIDAI